MSQDDDLLVFPRVNRRATAENIGGGGGMFVDEAPSPTPPSTQALSAGSIQMKTKTLLIKDGAS